MPAWSVEDAKAASKYLPLSRGAHKTTTLSGDCIRFITSRLAQFQAKLTADLKME